jgi:hypothetical protein
MPELVSIPTQTFDTRKQMLKDQELTPWYRNRFVLIQNDELYGGGYSMHLYRNGVLKTLYAEKGGEVIGLPAGGKPGQVLVKVSGNDYEVRWADRNGGIGYMKIGSTFKVR